MEYNVYLYFFWACIATDCFEFKGSYDGMCTFGGVEASYWDADSSIWPDDVDHPGAWQDAPSAEAWCAVEPTCIGYTCAFMCDRYYLSPTEEGFTTLDCVDVENEECGDGTPLRGCYVKFICGESTPYNAKDTQPPTPMRSTEVPLRSQPTTAPTENLASKETPSSSQPITAPTENLAETSSSSQSTTAPTENLALYESEVFWWALACALSVVITLVFGYMKYRVAKKVSESSISTTEANVDFNCVCPCCTAKLKTEVEQSIELEKNVEQSTGAMNDIPDLGTLDKLLQTQKEGEKEERNSQGSIRTIYLDHSERVIRVSKFEYKNASGTTI